MFGFLQGILESGRGAFLQSLSGRELSLWIREWRHKLPETRAGRTLLGTALIFGGLLSFLPVLGIWMLPLGLFILSIDWAFIRRRRRVAEVRLSRWKQGRQG